jgi:hypothetical protein
MDLERLEARQEVANLLEHWSGYYSPMDEEQVEESLDDDEINE